MRGTAIVLAGRRDGALDALAAEAGVDFKCLVPIAGKPLIVHVLRALEASGPIEEIRIVGGDAAAIEEAMSEAPATAGARRRYFAAAFNLVDSVMLAAEGVAGPVLVTTADNVLLTPDAVTEFIDKAALAGPGCAVAMAQREAVLAAHPDGQRRFYRFSDGEFSNCNLYWIGSPQALRAAETFRSGGQFVKYPARIAKAFGLANLIRFKLGIGSFEGFLANVGRRLGFPVRLVVLGDGAVAIDVDHKRSHGVAEEILRGREA